ncbi:hypothetical protein E8E13_004101 [Curvularia kusanoi]|uniref:Uncharacterized protein n=1 Tax=Curvularia kusanoi TaxID=90978 RepID=A0A9P4T6W4_CURKU|nr:hypothetical protein E8E13_004101 [Curvularia kusanoi]
MAPVRKNPNSTHGRLNKPTHSAQMRTHVATPKRKLFRGNDVTADNYLLSSPGPQGVLPNTGPQEIPSNTGSQVTDSAEDTDMEGTDKEDTPVRDAYSVFQNNDSGEDTEMEEDSTTEVYYLHKQSQPEATRVVTTLYGDNVRVWQSFGGTVYTCVEGEVVDGQTVLPRTRLPREGEKRIEPVKGISNDKVKKSRSKSTRPSSSTTARRAPQGRIKRPIKALNESPPKAPTPAPALVQALTSVSVFVPALTAPAAPPATPLARPTAQTAVAVAARASGPALAPPTALLAPVVSVPAPPAPPAPPPLPLVPHRPRDPTTLSTQFHHGSAAINPLGALARPLHPYLHRNGPQRPLIPKPRVLDPLSAPSVGNLPLKANPQLRRLVHPFGPAGPAGSVGLADRLAPAAPAQQQQQQQRRQITSGSFGTFEGRPADAFDERAYRLFPTGGGGVSVEKAGKEGDGKRGSIGDRRDGVQDRVQERVQEEWGAATCKCGKCCV